MQAALPGVYTLCPLRRHAAPGQTLADPHKMGRAHLTDLQRGSLPAALDVTRSSPDARAEGVLVTQDVLSWVLRYSHDDSVRRQVIS